MRYCKYGSIFFKYFLRCKNVNCKLIHNRNKNSVSNMYKITKSIFEGKGRPKEYCREKENKNSFTLNDVIKPIFILFLHLTF